MGNEKVAIGSIGGDGVTPGSGRHWPKPLKKVIAGSPNCRSSSARLSRCYFAAGKSSMIISACPSQAPLRAKSRHDTRRRSSYGAKQRLLRKEDRKSVE